MNRSLQTVLSILSQRPRLIFLIDGIGASLTAFFLLAILTTFEDVFGMPLPVLYLLAAIALVFAAYSFVCYFFVKANWRFYLAGIAVANTCYCVLSIGLVVYSYSVITVWGILYFTLEVFLVLLLVLLERKLILAKEAGSY